MIMRMNELKTLTKHILCQCKWKFDGKKCNLNNCQRECKNSKKTLRVWKGITFRILLHVVPKMVNI